MGGVEGILTGLPEKVCRYSGLFLLKTNSRSTSKGRECQAVSSMIINVFPLISLNMLDYPPLIKL